MLLRKHRGSISQTELLLFVLLTYALLSPRLKLYGYVQLLPVAYFLLSRYPALLIVDLFGLFAPLLPLPQIIASYHPWFALLINWFCFVHLLRQGEKNPSGLFLESQSSSSERRRLMQGLSLFLLAFAALMFSRELLQVALWSSQ